MSEDKEYKRYDSDCSLTFVCARVATDPTCIESKEGKPLVRFKVVAERANERFEPLWLEVNVGQWNAKACSFLQKNDVLGKIRGPVAMRLWGDDNENTSISVEFAEVTIPPALFKELKERGFEGNGEPNWTESDGKKKGGKKDKKKSSKPDPKKGKPAAKKASAALDEPEDDEDEGDDEEDLEIED